MNVRVSTHAITGSDPSHITQNLPENQCIFVRGYRAVRILNTWPKLRGLVGPLLTRRRPGLGFDQRLQLISIPEGAEVSNSDLSLPLFDASKDQDPLRILLEYIVEVSLCLDRKSVV